MMPPNSIPMRRPSDSQGWLLEAPRNPKKTRCIMPVEDLEAILGGTATTLGMVSRMEVREGTMLAPEMVVSQYLRFYRARRVSRI